MSDIEWLPFTPLSMETVQRYIDLLDRLTPKPEDYMLTAEQLRPMPMREQLARENREHWRALKRRLGYRR